MVPRHEIEPSSKTTALSKADSVIIFACPELSGDTFHYTNDEDLENTLKKIDAYFADNSLEGEYYLWPVDADSKKEIGRCIKTYEICPAKASGDSEAVRMVKGDIGNLINDILFIVVAIVLAIAAYYLFSSHKLSIICKILGAMAALLAAFFGIVGIIAIAMLAFKYILIAIGSILVIVFCLGAVMQTIKSNSESNKEIQRHGWVSDTGRVFMSKEDAEKDSMNPQNVHPV